MTDLIGSFRSLPPAQKVLVGGVAVVAALVLLAALPHLLGAVVGIVLALLGLAIFGAVLAGVIFAAWALFRAVSRQS